MPDVVFTFGNKSKTYTISTANVQRIQSWAAATYPTIPNPAYDPTKLVDPVTNPRTIPNPEPVLSAIDGLWQGVKANVQSYERQQAQQNLPTPGDLT